MRKFALKYAILEPHKYEIFILKYEIIGITETQKFKLQENYLLKMGITEMRKFTNVNKKLK